MYAEQTTANTNSPLAATQEFFRALLVRRDLEGALGCLADDVVWFGTGAFEVVHNKAEAEQLMADEIESMPQGYAIEFADLSAKTLTAEVGTVLGRVLVTDKAGGSSMDCRITTCCVRRGQGFVITSLHMSLPTALQSETEYYPVTFAENMRKDIITRFFLTNSSGMAASAAENQEPNELLEQVNMTLSDILNSIPGGIAVYEISPQGLRTVFFNQSLAHMTGYTYEEYKALSDKSALALVFAEDLPRLRQEIEQFIADRQPLDSEYRIYHKDGHYFWMHLYGVLKDRIGDALYAYAVFVDITAKKAMAERLRISEEQTRLAMSQMGKMLCLYDIATRTLTVPAAYAAKHDLPDEVLPEMPARVEVHRFLDPASVASFIAFFEAILRGEKTGVTNVRFKCADGSWGWEKGEFVTIFNTEGQPIKALIAIEDVTSQRKREAEQEIIRQNEELLRIVANHTDRGIMKYDLASRTTYSQSGIAQKYDFADIQTNMPYSAVEAGLISEEGAADYISFFDAIHRGDAQGTVTCKIKMGGGKLRWTQSDFTTVYDRKSQPVYAVISMEDVHDRYEKELAYKRTRNRLEALPEDAMLYYEADLTRLVLEREEGQIIDPLVKTMGEDIRALLDYGIARYVRPEDQPRLHTFFSRERLLAAFAAGIYYEETEIHMLRGNGALRWTRITLEMVEDPFTGNVKAFVLFRDIDEQKKFELDMRQLAETDGMTQLYNRVTTESLIRQALAQNPGEPCALLLADIDDLKFINDHLGHAQGDRSIIAIASALKSHFRSTDIVGRIGGDEFMAFLRGAMNETQLRGTLLALVRKLNRLRVGENNDTPLHGSVGVVTGVAGQDDFTSLYKKADTALYHVKRNGKNDFAFFTPDMELADYQFTGHEELRVDKIERFDAAELRRLLRAISSYFPLVISANLTRNSYYMLEYETYTTKKAEDAGRFDDLIELGAQTFHPDDRAAFVGHFSRANLLKAYARGETSVSYEGRQLGDDGVYHRIKTTVIFMTDEKSGDVCEITLGRVIE